MTSSIFCFDKPAQSIRELRTVGIDGIMFDFSVFCSAQSLLNLKERIEKAERAGEEKPKWKPEETKIYYQKVTEAFAASDFLPSIARLLPDACKSMQKGVYETAAGESVR